MPGLCPTPERLAAALRGRQPGGDDAELAAHLSDCPACQAQLEALAGGSGWLEAKPRTHAATASTASEPLRQAMRTLESRTNNSEREAPSPPKLDFLQPSDQPGVLGRFGPYEVIAHVASGGMGVVLKARDPALDRVVALKILPPALAANALARARFVREARAAAAVVHEHVVPIYAVDECAGLPYLVMQFVQGRTLAERIRATGPLRLEEILRIGAQTAAGLAAAHAQGLIHRDVKPGNILLENSVERVKLTDFGLARAVDDAGLTRTGELAGTPEFMSPEQAGNEAVDHRSDLFSFGSVLYAMGTGCSPFQGNSVVAVIRKVCDAQPPPVHDVNPSMPRWLSDIVARLMAKEPADRIQSAREVSELLERYLARVQHGELSELPEASRRRASAARNPKRVAIGVAAALAVAALLFVVFKDRHAVTSIAQPPASSQDPFVVRTEAGTSVGAFANLEDALKAAPAGGVLELHWTDSREMRPIKLPAKPLTLRAGRGFQPSWISTDASASALSASEGLTLEGIRFALDSNANEQSAGAQPAGRGQFRPPMPRAPPSGVALVSITNGELRVTRCTLQIVERGASEPACINLVNVSACRLDSTILLAPLAKGVVWQQHLAGSPDGNTKPAPAETSLTITNCIAFAAEAVWLELDASSRARLEIVRCTFGGPTGFYLPPGFTTANLEVDARHSLFDSASIILDARNAAAPALPLLIRWRERENLFSPRRRFIVLAPPKADNGPARLSEWNQWWNQSGEGSRQVQVAYASGRGDANPGGGSPSTDPSAYQITDLRVTEGRPLERNDWSRFGADTANVGPAPSE